MSFEGRLEEAWLQEAFDSLSRKVTPGVTLLIDCSSMSSYEPAARALFVSWHREHRQLIPAVAIVTTNMLYRMIIATMALASSQQMRGFDDAESAREWLDRAR